MRHQLPCDSCARAGKVQVANYRCPACARCSCSLSCVKSHKTHYNCTGVRDKTAPVPKRNYDEHNLVSDYSLLEEAKRQKENAKRNRIRNKFLDPANVTKLFDPIPRYKQRVMGQEAAKRGIDLRFMPPVFYRHKNNTSHVKPVDYSRERQGATTRRPFDKLMVWRVDIHFCGPNGGTRLVQIHHLDEEVNMSDVLERAIHTLEIRKEPRLNGDTDQYLLYAGMSGSKLSAYIRNDTDLGRRTAEPSILPDWPRHKRRKLDHTSTDPSPMDLDTRGFIPVDISKTLRESLSGALVVEYPILFVAPKGSADDKQLENATKSLFTKPEPEVDSTFPLLPPHSNAGRANRHPGDDEHPDTRMADAAHSQAEHANSTQRSGRENAFDTSPGSMNVTQNGLTETKPLTSPEMLPKGAIPSESQERGQKRKAEESGDSEGFRSELEGNLTCHLTPRKTNGGKTGYTRDGKLRVSESHKPSPVPFSLSKLRTVMLPGAHDNGVTKDQDYGIRKDGEVMDVEEGETAKSHSDSDHYSGQEEDDSEGVTEKSFVKKAVGEEDGDGRELEDDEEEVGSAGEVESNEDEEVEVEQQDERGETEEDEGKDGEDEEFFEAAEQEKVGHEFQDRGKPSKRQRLPDIQERDLKNEDSLSGGHEKAQIKDSEGMELDDTSAGDNGNRNPRKLPTVESSPRPFAKVDSVLLDTRIPRRKKLSDPNGREPLTC